MQMAGWAGLAALLVVAALMPWPLLLGPNNWWAFILVTAAIAGALRLLLGRQWTGYAGLKLPPTHVLMVAVAFAMVATASGMLLPIIYEAAGLKAGAPDIREQTGFLFQAFNEEILFRALLIGFIVQYVRWALPVSLVVAFLFSAAHFLLYRFSNPMHLALSITALATLFLAGVAWNNLYLAFRHIGFSWALHAGWNVVWLPAPIYDATTNARLREPQLFDLVLGSPIICATACVMAALSFVFLARRPPAHASDFSS
jgi:membrane protease YdiL (CAAX protease family)